MTTRNIKTDTRGKSVPISTLESDPAKSNIPTPISNAEFGTKKPVPPPKAFATDATINITTSRIKICTGSDRQAVISSTFESAKHGPSTETVNKKPASNKATPGTDATDLQLR